MTLRSHPLSALTFVLAGLLVGGCSATAVTGEPTNPITETAVPISSSEPAAPTVEPGAMEFRAVAVPQAAVDSVVATLGSPPIPGADYSGSDFTVLFLDGVVGCDLSVDSLRVEEAQPYVKFFFELATAEGCTGPDGLQAIQVKIPELLFTTDNPMEITLNGEVVFDGIPPIIEARDEDYLGTLDWTQGWP